MPAPALDKAAPCPCASGATLALCCSPIIEGTAPAKTAEALMRSRYSAFALARIDHVTASLHPDARKDHDEAAARKWAEQSEWLGLTILATERGGESDEKGTVEFKCRYRVKGELVEHHERAYFVRHDGAWVFRDSEIPKQPTYVRSEPRIGRNDPCACGSGKKAKRCCA